jgi:hypothetical protein
VQDLDGRKRRPVTAKSVFIGAGGGALPLLQKSGIPEGHSYAGFPVSGIWLCCDDPAVNKRHHAKVYGKASVGSPPMSVPHPDPRVIGGHHSRLFGPYAGFSTKFLKRGSLLDLVESIRPANIEPLLAVARDNLNLTNTSHRAGAAVRKSPPGDAGRVLPEGGSEGLAATDRRTARTDHQARRQKGRAPGIRHRTRRRRRGEFFLVALLGASPGALLIGMASTSDSIDEIRCVGRLLHAEPDIGPS